jgi:hypothetical protein
MPAASRRMPPTNFACYLSCPRELRTSQKGDRPVPDNRLRCDSGAEHPHPVQRLFSMFPPGLPGIGLLLLRISVAIGLLLEGYGHRQVGWIHATAVLLSITLFAGYVTPIAAAAGLLFHGLIWLTSGGGSAAILSIVSLDITALALLGPGAYSVDASLFGRRVVVLPPS